MFKMALMNLTELKMSKARIKQKLAAHQEVTWKLLKAPNYIEKLHYFDQEIENMM